MHTLGAILIPIAKVIVGVIALIGASWWIFMLFTEEIYMVISKTCKASSALMKLLRELMGAGVVL